MEDFYDGSEESLADFNDADDLDFLVENDEMSPREQAFLMGCFDDEESAWGVRWFVK